MEGLVRLSQVVQFLGTGKVGWTVELHSRVAGNRTAQIVTRNAVAVTAQIVPHGQLLEAECPQGYFVQHFPARVAAVNAVPDFGEIARAPMRVVIVRCLVLW